MSWFSKWMGNPTAPPAPEPEHEPAAVQGQIRMTLEERVAFRRKMVLETVQEVLLVHGMTEKRFHMSVARIDERGHQYAVMIDLFPDASGQLVDSPQEWQSVEQRITQLAMSRYRIKVTHVYWRFDALPPSRPAAAGAARTTAPPPVAPRAPVPAEPEVEYAAWHIHPARQTAPASTPAPIPMPAPAPAANAFVPIPVAPLSAATKIAAAILPSASRTASDDGFPDTQMLDGNTFLDDVSADELRAFEEAIRQGHDADQPLKLGKRTYQTDFMPLE